MKKVICFGEIMMRLNPKGYQRFLQANEYEVSYAGGEANVAVSVSNFGLDAALVTKLPENELGQCAINAVRAFGVDTSRIIRGGNRLGKYFVEKGASQRASKVIYDRSASSIAMARREDFDWKSILKDARWFHFTGITPALGGELPEIVLDACKVAKELSVTVSCDLNYRKKLWSRQDANNIMTELMPYVDVLISNEEDAFDVFGIVAHDTDVEGGKLDYSGYKSVAKQLVDRFRFKKVAITLRGSISASLNEWAGMLYEEGESYFSPKYTISLVDRVGGGDSFGGALIYSQLSGYGAQDSINFAVAASCLKQATEHDFNLASVDEIRALAAGNVSGRVQR